MTTDKKEIEGKLIIDDLSDNAYRVRRNLLVFSFVAIFYKLSGASIDKSGVSFYGINFNHIDENFISIGIFLVVFYHLFHFLLIAIGHWQYLKIRTTQYDGGRIPGMLSVGVDDYDFPSNPKDSSLYYWYSKLLPRLLQSFSSSRKSIDALRSEIEEKNFEKVEHKLTIIETNIKNLNSKRLIKSLKNFDDSLRCYRLVELSRWLLIEILIPILCGFVALGLLYFKY